MACQLFRKDGKVDKVLASNEKPSLLYPQILERVKSIGAKKFIDNIPYLRDRLADGGILNDSPEEVAVGLWSMAYTPEFESFFSNMNKAFGVFADENGEPKFQVFSMNILDTGSRFAKVGPSYILDEEKVKFSKVAGKRGNPLQQAIVAALVEKPENPVVLEPVNHVYIDEEGRSYTSVTTAIKGKLENDAYAANRAIGTAVDKLLQGIIANKPFGEAKEGITELDDTILKGLYNALQAYIDGLTRDGSIVITQTSLGDPKSLRAGSPDILVVSPSGRIRVVDLKVSKNSVKGTGYDVKYPVKTGSVFMGQMLSTRQQHGIQVGAYMKLIELQGFTVDDVSTVHIKVELDPSNKVVDATWEGELRHPLSINKDMVDKVIPTEVTARDRAAEIRKEVGADNPANDPDFLDSEESKPERELYGEDLFERMYNEVKKVINLFETRKKYLEKIKEGKTSIDKNLIIDKINELIVFMGSELRSDKPSVAYGSFLRFAAQEIKEYLAKITDPNAINDPNYITMLLEVDKYIESYRGVVTIKGAGSKEQQQMLLSLLDILDDTKEAIDHNIENYVKKIVNENTSRNLTEEELNNIMKEVYDIPVEDYYLGDMATSKDTLLAIADKLYKSAVNKAKDNTEATISRIQQLGMKLLKAAGVSKPDEKFYDFMKVFDKGGKFFGRYVNRVGTQYYDLYYTFKNLITEKNGDRKQYIPILDLSNARQEDIDYNVKLFRDKAKYRNFMNAEILGSNGAEDGIYHKYTDAFKIIRNRYEDLVRYEKPGGEVYYRWERKANVSQEQYERYLLKYYNEVDYWGAVLEDGVFKGQVALKKGYFVKNEFIEVRDIAGDGTDLRDPKYTKLMNPTTELERAQSEFYRAWIEEYEKQLEKLPPDVAAQMRGKVGRVSASFFDTLKSKGPGFVSAVSKGIKNLFTPDIYTNQRLVDELGQIDAGLPILYVGKLQSEKRVEYLKNELNKLKNKRTEGKISQKDYLAEKKKLREYLRIEEGKLKASEIEGDLVKNLTAFATMSENYDMMSNIESDLQAIAKVMNDRVYYEVDTLGRRLIQKGSKMTKDDEGKSVVKRSEDVLATKRLKKWFQMVYYNNHEFSRSVFTMVSQRIQNLTSLKGVGFNVFGNLNNYIMGRINTSIESAGGLYYDRKAGQRAANEYNTDYLPGVFRGLATPDGGYYVSKKPNSKYEALVDKFRMIRKYQADSGRVDVMSWAYILQEGGEYNVQSKSGIAVLMSRQITNQKTGMTMSIYDAFDFNPNTGELLMKDGFELSDKERYAITNYIYEVNKQIHGNYAFEDRMVIQESTIGQLAAQFHKWIYPAYKVRFKNRYFDENLGEVEGRYVTVMNLVKYMKESEGNFLEKMRTGWKDLDAIQIKNMYKNIAELAFFAASFAMYGVFRALAEGADDDDKTMRRWLNFLAYQQSRQMTEVATMMPIVGMEEQYFIAKSPIAILSTLKDFGQALKTTLLIPFPPYEKNFYERGPHDGDLKAWKEWKDVIPALSVLNKWEAYDQVKSFYIK